MTTTEQTLSLPDGRELGYAEYGAGDRTVISFHGSGGSRLERPLDAGLLSELGVRFVATDRPGHGLSSPHPGRRLLDGPADIARLADHLGAETFAVVGWSAGGPHALACAHQLPQRVSAGAIVSGLAPVDRPNPYAGLPPGLAILNAAGRRAPTLVRLFRRLTRSMVMGDPDTVATRLGASFPPVDRQVAADPQQRRMLIASLQEGYRQGWQGPAQDDLMVNSAWDFRLEDIQVRIDVWQGELDRNVPLGQGRYQSARLPNSSLTVVPAQGHLYLLTHWRDVLIRLLA